MKFSNLGVYQLKDKWEQTYSENCSVEHILDAMMKRAPVGFLCILGIQYMIGSVFSFPVILKPKGILYFHALSHHNFH